MSDPIQLPYNGRSGFVAGSDTSTARSDKEDSDGTSQSRLERVLDLLIARPQGLTWAEVGSALTLHHGQASGALSMLHKQGLVFALHATRNRSHIYVAARYKDRYADSERIDQPVKTRATREADALEVLIQTVDDLLLATHWDTIAALKAARAVYKTETGR